jgi:hypothetical protein
MSTATFPPLSESDHATKPDITIAHPNIDTPTASTDWEWHLAASIIEVKRKTGVVYSMMMVNSKVEAPTMRSSSRSQSTLVTCFKGT